MGLKGKEQGQLEGALKDAKADLRDGKIESMAVIFVREGSPKGIDCLTGVVIEGNTRAKVKMAALLALQVKKICLGNAIDFDKVAKVADAIMKAEAEEDMKEMMK